MKPLLPNVQLLCPVINIFRKCFSKPQFKQFERYLCGLILLANKTIDAMATATLGTIDQSSLNRFLTSAPWNAQAVEKKYFGKIKQVFGRNSVSLVIDDSLAKKTGKHIDDVQYHKNHSSSGFVFGHQFVTAVLRVKDWCFPLFPKLYSKRTCSKIDFAKQIIVLAVNNFRVKEVILDSWYMASEVIKTARQRGLHVTGCLKSNRTVSFDGKDWLKISSQRKKLKAKNATIMIVDDATYQVHELMVRVKKIGIMKVLITRQWLEKDKKWSRPFYLASTNTQLSAAQIIRTYATRWSIETFHRDAKQYLGLEDCQVRARTGIIRHLMLTTLAYAILKLWQHLKNVSWTIGETIRCIQGQTFDDMIISIVEENSIEKRWKLAEPFISKNAKV